MSRQPGHRKFNVTREVISKGTDGKKHFCNGEVQEEGSGLSTEQTIDTGLPLISLAIKIEKRGAGKEKDTEEEVSLSTTSFEAFLRGH